MVDWRRVIPPLVLALLITATGASAGAQTAATGTIAGVVTDQTGGVLPGVTVAVRNLDTNLTRELVTDDSGRYRAAALPPGTYEVTARRAGFDAKPVTNVQLLVGTTVPVDVQMRAAGVAEAVTVTAESPLVDTRRTDVSNVVTQESIQNLPINGRRWENFVLLGPGVTNDGGFGLVSYRGISGLYNNNTVDGADNNQAFFSEARGRTRTSYSISQEAIQEFQVGISNFSAEFGRAAGGTVNAVTKSGTNQVRGTGFYFRRDDEYQAREPFAPSKPEERRQQFGLTLGGPIRRDRLFYFGNADQQLRSFPYFVRTSSVTFLDQTCTAPGCAATRTYFSGLSAFGDRKGNNRIFLGKLDATLSSEHTLTVQYNVHRWTSPNGVQTAPILSVATSANGDDIVHTDFALARLNSILGPRWLNEVRVQVGRDFEAQTPNGPGPSTTVSGGISSGMPNFLPRPKYPEEWRYQVIDNVSWYAGPHSLKMGLDVNYVREDIINLFQGGGVYSYPSLQAIAADCPPDARGCTPLVDATTGRHYTTFTQAFDLRGLQGDVFFTTTDYNFFVQDNWQLTDQLMLNLGLRYEYQTLPQPTETEVNHVAFAGNPAYPATQRFHQDKNNWGPRLGFTYDLGGRHETVLRGGFGIYYGRTSNSAISSALTNNAATFATYVFTPATPGAPTYPAVLSAPPTIAGSRPQIQYVSLALERPEIYMGDLTIDRDLAYDVSVSASYLFSKGRKLPTFVNTNLPPPSAQVTYVVGTENKGTFPFFRGTRPDTRIDAAIEVRGDVDSQYHGLVLQATKRFSHGVLFNANYTLAKATDAGQNSTTFIASFSNQYNPFDIGAEKGTSTFDRRHRFVGSFHYGPDYLMGVQIGGIVTMESGLPSTASISGGVTSASGAVNTSSTNGSGASNRVPFLTRNSFRQPERRTVDLRVSKAFNLGGRRRLIALWEAFNVFNRTNFTGVSSTRYRVGSSSYDPTATTVTVNLTEDTGFLRPTSASNTLWGPRDMQLGLRVLW